MIEERKEIFTLFGVSAMFNEELDRENDYCPLDWDCEIDEGPIECEDFNIEDHNFYGQDMLCEE